MLTQDIIRELGRPFSEEDVKFRPQKGNVLAYIDSRAIINRLNAVVGAENWSDEYDVMQMSRTKAAGEVETFLGMKCRLTIFGVTKEDLSDPDNVEIVKSLASGSLKRAAVKFGIGLYLYELKGLAADTTYEDLPEWAKAEYQTHDDRLAKLYATLDTEKKVTADKILSDAGYVLSKTKKSVVDLGKELKGLTA